MAGAILYKNRVYGAGGSNVEANPSGSATDDLEKIGIDGTVYDVTDADAVHSSDKGVANGVASLDANGRVSETANYARTAGMANQGSFVFTPQNSDYDGSVGLIFVGTSQQYAPQELLEVPYKSGTLATTGDIKDGTLTIQKDGVDVETFTANSATNKTANITVASDIATAKNDLTVIAEKTDTDPYIYRPSVANGDRVREDIVGASVGWNQIINTRSFTNSNTDTRTNVNFQVYFGSNLVLPAKSITSNGVYNYIVKATENNTTVRYRHSGASRDINFLYENRNTVKDHVYIVSVTFNGYNPSTVGGLVTDDMMLSDITLDFGATIADHIYSLEQATAGAGVAFFRKYFPNAYYPYNAGELLSVEVEGKKYVGKNLVEESFTGNIGGTGGIWADTSYSMHVARIIQGKTYTITTDDGAGAVYGFYTDKPQIGSTSYDSVRVVSNNKTFTAPINGYIAFRSNLGYSTPQCELGNTATTYEPYKEYTYTFPSQTLRGLFTLVDGELKASGDVYGDSGVIKRKFKRYNMGGIEWGFSSTDQVFWTSGIESTKNLIACGYVFKDIADVTNNATAAQYLGNLECTYRHGSTNDRVYFKNSAYTDKSSFVAAMNDVYMDIELPTPTTEQAEPLVMPQICDKNGTEEFITTSIVPVGHESTYYNYPDYMESGEYKDFRDRVDYAAEKAKWKKVGEYAGGETVTINGTWNEIMLCAFQAQMGGGGELRNSVIYPFDFWGKYYLEMPIVSSYVYITDSGYVDFPTGVAVNSVIVYVR